MRSNTQKLTDTTNLQNLVRKFITGERESSEFIESWTRYDPKYTCVLTFEKAVRLANCAKLTRTWTERLRSARAEGRGGKPIEFPVVRGQRTAGDE